MCREIIYLVLCLVCLSACNVNKEKTSRTYCNPVNISYRFRPERDQISRREAADPSVVLFKGKYYLFASKSGGYWSSDNLLDWHFITTDDLPWEAYAPAAVSIGDTLYFAAFGGPFVDFYKTSDPEEGHWEKFNPEIPYRIGDPAFFKDEDNRLFLYYGCSNKEPLYGIELDPSDNLKPIGKPVELLKANILANGWEVPGDNNEIQRAPWLEGAWMNKENGRYYLQYAGPGTEFRSYADGYYVSDNPLGPFTYSPYSPFSRKTGGFATGIGHSCTFKDKVGNYWHMTTMAISVKHMFERRLCLFPSGFDKDGVLFCQTAFGDYPHYLPSKKRDLLRNDTFTNWMLLSYRKEACSSSCFGKSSVNNAFDENIKTYWSAEGGEDEWLQVDLGKEGRINAVQVNFAEEGANIHGRQEGVSYQYYIQVSEDGVNWITLVDKKSNYFDCPHDYVELEESVVGRFVRLHVLHVPDGKIAVSGFRVFGKGFGKCPASVKELQIKRDPKDPRRAKLKWWPSPEATGYVIHYGIERDKLYQSTMVYDATELDIRSLNVGSEYYFSVDAFNESGVTKGIVVF